MNIQEFFYKYFVEPIKLGYGYNIVNTTTYALIFVVFTYLLYKFLKKLKIKINEKFAIAVFPYVSLGVVIRVLRDANILHGYLYMTPNIWFLFSGIIIFAILFSIFLEKKFKLPYYKLMFISGFILLSLFSGMLKITNFTAIFYISLIYLPIIFLLKLVKWSIENKIIFALHAFDSVVTSIAITYFGYYELHVLPRFLIETTGTAFSFIIVKLIAVSSALIILDKYSDDKEFNNFIKLMIAILGFVPGSRDFLRLIWMT